jgi:hypothetical protein
MTLYLDSIGIGGLPIHAVVKAGMRQEFGNQPLRLIMVHSRKGLLRIQPLPCVKIAGACPREKYQQTISIEARRLEVAI